jgi:hypothetical protein
MKVLSLLVVVLLISANCLAQKKLKQGVHGKVFWISGNQMPGPEKKSSPQEGVQREIFVYEATRLNQTVQQNGFFTQINTKLITQGRSMPDGSFRIQLPPGHYSVFVQEPNGLYANLFDSDNLINPITVKSKAYTWLTIAIDYQAAY